jgi:D-arabinose 1-dehydrogenase-like Zn-dependent alcohol dehydrogenase
MRAAVVEAFKEPLAMHNDWKDPAVGPDDVLIKVKANAICRSDWHIWQGEWDWLGFSPELPAVLGHECSGVVEDAGCNVSRFNKGDRVVVPFGHACGTCGACSTGNQHVCENLSIPLFTTGGAFAEYTLIAHGDLNLVPLHESMSFVDAASLGCRFMTAFRGIATRAKVRAGEWVAVFGCGGVGLAAVHIATALGANVIAVSRTAQKLEKAEELGAVRAIQAGNETPAEIQDYTNGGVDVSVECLGSATTWTPAFLSLRTGGRLLRLGMSGAEDRGVMPLLADVLVARELTVLGSFGMQARCFPDMLRMVRSGRLHPAKLVGQEISLEQTSDVLESMSAFDTVGYSVISMS